MPASDDNGYTPAGAMPDYLIRHATLRQLQVFEAIVRLGSFTRAAEELFLTQPTVSMQIRKLTDAMGLPLFEHVGRNVEPTEAGMELYEACRRMFETLANLEMKIADLKGLKLGRLRMGVITTAKYLAPEILGEFSRLYPGIDLALKVTNRERIIERMHGNEDDLYIMGQAPEDELDVAAFPFAPNPLVVMAPRDHPLVAGKTFRWLKLPNIRSSCANLDRVFAMPRCGCSPLRVYVRRCAWNLAATKPSSTPWSAVWACPCCRYIP